MLHADFIGTVRTEISIQILARRFAGFPSRCGKNELVMQQAAL